jgi:type I restriction enzyme S subunit
MFKLGRGLGITKSNLIDEGVPCVNYGEIHSKFGFEVAPEKHDLKCVPEDYLESSPNALLEHGDFVYADTSEDIEGSGNFTHLNSTVPTFAGYHTVTAKPLTNNHSKFLAYLFHSELFRFQIRKSVSGVKVFSVTQDILKSCYVWLPPTTEQTQIAKFLDYKTAQLDRLLEKKKALIEKLNEQRIAMITQAVTKGLNPDAPMKDSEVGWLGEVPEHWEIKPLKFSFNNLNNRRIPLSAEERTGMPKNYRYYGASGVIDMVENYIFDEPTVLIGEDGANLLSRSTPLAFEATGKYWVNNHAHILSPIEGPFSYWSNLLCSVQYDPWITGSAQPKLTKDNLGSILLPRPPVEEQHSIADFVNKTASKIDPMIDLAETTIEKLNEYRTALITAAVTGKIDVREVEIPKQGAA